MNKEKISFAEEVKERKYFNRRNIGYFFLGVAVALAGVATFHFWGFWGNKESGSLFSPNSCVGGNVGVIKIIGEINTEEDAEFYSVSAPKIVQQTEELENNSDIKGILVDIDSGGGSPESSESIMLALKKSSKPVVAIIRDISASGAYMVALGADRIYASKFSSVGSIGITRDFLDTSEKDRKDGVIFHDFSSGKYKGMTKDHSKMTEEERKVIMEDIMKFHDVFVDYVSENRNLSKERVRTIATGRTYTGADALELGLIDQIGGLPEAEEWLKETIGEELSYCFAKEWTSPESSL